MGSRWRLKMGMALTAGIMFAGLLVCALAALSGGSAQASSLSASAMRVERRSFYSVALGRSMPFEVYLPPGYDSTSYARVPVLYMLHGLGGNQTDWEADGLFTTATDLINSGDIPPMIIVTPAGDSGYWIDQAKDGPRYGTYVAHDLVSLIDSQYRTLADGSYRAIGGMSMGGHGALQLALNNPGEFSVVGAHSVALRTKAQAFDFFGDQRYFEAHDPVSLYPRNQVQARQMTIWIDIGRSDTWYAPATSFHQLLVSQHISHVWNTYDGGHDATYWHSHVADYLRFYGEAFQTETASAVAR
jgi:enterochelin esterase-like enzyme